MELQLWGKEPPRPQSYYPLSRSRPSFFSRLLFSWVGEILNIGKKSKVSIDDCYELPEDESTENEKLTFYLSRHKLFKALFLANLKVVISAVLLGNVIALLDFSSPFFMKLLMAYLNTSDKPLSWGIYLAIIFSTITMLNPILTGKYEWIKLQIERRVRTSLSNIVYCKILKATSIPSGLGVNIIQVDVKKIDQSFRNFSNLISCPIQGFFSIFLIYMQVGDAVYAAIGVLTVCFTMNYFINKKVRKCSEQLMKIRDQRIDASSQMLTNIKMVKAYVWENFFKNNVDNIRKKELKELRFIMILSSVWIFFFWAIPSITVASVFLYYTLVMNMPLTSEKAFVSLATVTILQESLQDLPWLAAQLMGCLVSIKRIQGFLDIPDLESLPSSECIEIKNCTFAYKDKAVLHDINLNIKNGEFLAVIGPVGCGKSSLLASIMGELNILKGNICVTSEIAYAPSLDSWIQNDTLRNNILFGKPYVEKWYLKVIEACCLIQDINSLLNKDFTEIGERGINLSGGQKARICLARAVYADKDVYLLDDPLSSVDTFVAEHIMNKCFLKLLAKKTRVLVTHRLNILNKVDKIIVLENGKISKESSPEAFKISENLIVSQEPQIEEISSSQPKLIQDEEKETGKVDWKVIMDYFKFSGGFAALTLSLLMMLLYTIAKMSGDIILKQWSDNPDDIRFYLPIYLSLRVGGNIFIFFRAFFILAVLGINASRYIHTKLIEVFVRAPVNLFYDVTPIGRLLNRLSKDLNAIDEMVSKSLSSITNKAFQISSMVIMAAIYFPVISIALPVLFYLSLKIQRLYLGASRELTRLEAISMSPILNHFTETLSGLKIIRTFKQTENFHRKNSKLVDNNIRLLYSIAACKCWLMTNMELLSSSLLCLLYIAVIIFRDDVSLGMVGLALTYVGPLPLYVAYVVVDLSLNENTMISVERARQYMSIIQENPEELPTDKNLQNWPELPTIEFKEVKMKYRPSTQMILKGVNFYIEAGKRIGIVGRTGSGKSTIYLCLLRIVELFSGSILIDGVNIANIGLHKLRSAITLVPQDPLVFNGNFENNLDPCHTKSQKQIKNTLEEVNLSRYPIDYQIKENGSNLSAGERQLLSLGRAMLANTKIILFDEATAGIDQDSDMKIQELIKNRFERCTILTIAHRLGTVMESDLIIVMQDGIAAEIGSPQELLSKNSIFKDLSNKII
ncbi:unnamed protein product [Blepharisma stoltei]|uniref:Uncharacterized protein n=1 Tax=Blepharisma stoltei TaxID=1481888 RepID=A0AAU9ILM7_9CILI|nr:unnamed protein product [Blepharisma stoltei]